MADHSNSTGFVMLEPSPVLLQVANVFFLGAAIFADLLLIRACLSVAFIALLVQSILTSVELGALSLDGILWSLLIGSFHWLACFSLGREEFLSPKLAGDDPALYAYLHRRTGMHKLDFLRLRAVGKWLPVGEGDQICDTKSARESLFILVQGRIHATYRYEDHADLTMQAFEKVYCSGDVFDYRALNAFGVFVGFPNAFFECNADGPGLVFQLPLRPLMELMESSPQILQLMRVYALGVLARSAQSGANELPRSFDSYGMPEDEEWLNNGHRSRDFQPLQPDELASMTATWRSFGAWLWSSISPRVPPGCRHGSNPLSGSLAQAQVKAKTVTGLIGLRQSFALLDSGTGRQPLLRPSTYITQV